MFLALSLLIPQIKWAPPYEVLPSLVDRDRYVAKLGSSNAGIFVDGDILTLISKGKTNPLVMMDWFKVPMKQIEGSDVWMSQAKMKDWSQAFFNYGVKDEKGKTEWRVFHAAKAPKIPVPTPTLKGTVTMYSRTSKVLGEDRNVFVYLPPNHPNDCPLVMMADGGACKEFALTLEPLILAKKIAPVAIIGIPSGGYRGPEDKYVFEMDYRMKEYLKVADPERFAQHLSFVCDEVLPWARSEFHLSSKREATGVYGYSNGGAFAMVAALDRPDVFGVSIPNSVAAFDIEALKKNASSGIHTKFLFTAGTLEVFVKNTTDAFNVLTDQKVPCKMQTYVSGHDITMWKLGFVKSLEVAFPYRR